MKFVFEAKASDYDLAAEREDPAAPRQQPQAQLDEGCHTVRGDGRAVRPDRRIPA